MKQMQLHYRDHPEWFFENFLGFKPYDKQIEIARSVRHNRVTAAASCNSAGKTGTSGCIVPWWLLSFEESIVVTTAPGWRQVKDLLWREINTRWEKAKFPLSPSPPNVTSWQISSNWFAVGLSSKDPNKVQGYHADSGYLLAIVDEAAGVEEPTFEGIDAILTSEKCRLLMIGNPTSQAGTFRQAFKPASIANRIKISAFDTPNFKANNLNNEQDVIQAIENKIKLKEPYPQLISPIWVYERIKKWGVNSPMYQSRVRANFPAVGENNLIPLNWIEAACREERLDQILKLNTTTITPEMSDQQQQKIELENKQMRDKALAEYIKSNNTVKGVDVARFGSDMTVIQPRWGGVVGQAKIYGKEDTMQTAGRVWAEIENMPTERIQVDVIGVGGGVVDRLRELQRELEARHKHQSTKIIGVNVATAANERPKALKEMEFANRRAQLYWTLREEFESGNIYIMPGPDGKPPEDLMDELSSIEYFFRGNKIYIEEKAEMKKRLLKSPDCFIGSTLINTPNGKKPIDSLRVGDKVSTPMGDKKIIKVWEVETDKLTTANFSNGSTLSGKGSHRIFTWDKGWVRLDALTLTNEVETDRIFNKLSWKLLKKLYTRASHFTFKQQVDIISRGARGKIQRRDFFTGVSGLITLARYPQTIRFITKTMIGRIIIYPTLSLSTEPNTTESICSIGCETNTLEKKHLIISKKHKKPLKNGTHQQKGMSGIGNTARKPGRNESLLKALVESVTKNLKHTAQALQKPVLINAGKKKLTEAVTRLLKTAYNATRSFLLTSLKTNKIVPRAVATERVQKTKVYNLTLDEENVYYANGILVENCADALMLTFENWGSDKWNPNEGAMPKTDDELYDFEEAKPITSELLTRY